MRGDFTRIFSDVHFGEHSSRVRSLAQLRPLCDGPQALILNGDTLDTRPGPHPQFTADCRAGVLDFFATVGPPATLITGNHDPDISAYHARELAAGQVWVTHGDVVFDDLVPWGRDAAHIRREIRARLATASADPGTLEERLRIWRQVAATIPQRHQSERNRLKYSVRLAIDLVWPPWRFPHMLAAWQSQPRKTAELARQHRLPARFALVGHTHRPGSWRTSAGLVVINTGSFCRPLGTLIVDLSPRHLTLRRLEFRRGEFRAGPIIREFTLAPEPEAAHAPPR